MDTDFTWLPFSSPGCLSLGRAVARIRIPFPSHWPNSNPVSLISVCFPEKPLSKVCAMGMNRKVSHLSSPLAYAHAGPVRREAGQNVSWPLTVKGCSQRNSQSENWCRVDRGKTGMRYVLVSRSKMQRKHTYRIVLEKLRETEANTRYAKQSCPNLLVNSRIMIYIGDTLLTEQIKRKIVPFPPTTYRKALKSSKVKLVTLQIQNDLLTCSKIYKK